MAGKLPLLCTVAGALFINGQTVNADELNCEEQNYQAQEPQKEKAESDMPLSEKLTESIMRWYDAVADGNAKKIAERKRQMLDLISTDLKSSETEVKRLEHESVATREGQSATKSVDRSREVEAREMLHAKKLLVSSIRQADSFGDTYRLLGDYLYLLRQDEQPTMAGASDSCSFTDSLK